MWLQPFQSSDVLLAHVHLAGSCKNQTSHSPKLKIQQLRSAFSHLGTHSTSVHCSGRGWLTVELSKLLLQVEVLQQYRACKGFSFSD